MTVFVSYAHKDSVFVEQLVKDLQAAGITIWQDRQRISGGANWSELLEEALTTATHMIFVMSKSSCAARSFVRKEVSFAQARQHPTIIPIRIDETKPPVLVADLHYIDFFALGYTAAFEQLLAALPREESGPVEDNPTAEDESAVERHARFWAGLQQKAHTAHLTLHDDYKPPQRNLFSATASYPKLKYRYVIHRRNASVQLYISTGSKARNKKLFDALRARREDIEAAFGEPLEWERLNKQQASRIQKTVLVASLKNEVNWPAAQDALIKTMQRFEAALRPHLDAISD